MLQNAKLGQRFAAGRAAAGGHHGEHIPAGDGGKMREAGESLEGAGKLMIIFIFGHVYTLTVASEQKLFRGPTLSRSAGGVEGCGRFRHKSPRR